MVLIETINCENALDAKLKEREYTEKLNASLNKSRPYINQKEKSECKKQCAKDNAEQVKMKNKSGILKTRSIAIKQ